MSILKLTKDHLYQTVRIEIEDDFTYEGTLVSIGDNTYEIKEQNGIITRIYDFEICDIRLLNYVKTTNQKGDSSVSKELEHPVFGHLANIKSDIIYNEITSRFIEDIDHNLYACNYLMVTKANNLYKRFIEQLSTSNEPIGVSCYNGGRENEEIRFLTVSGELKNGHSIISLIFNLTDISTNNFYQDYHELIQLLESNERLKIVCNGSSLIDFLRSILDLDIVNYIDLQILYFGIHNLKMAQTVTSGYSYSRFVSKVFATEFDKQLYTCLSSNEMKLDVVLKKMAFNTHYLVPLYKKLLNQLLDPVKVLSSKVCSNSFTSDLDRMNMFNQLPRSLQFWSYRDQSNHIQARNKLSKELKEQREFDSGFFSNQETERLRRQVIESRDIAQGRDDKSGYVEELSDYEDESNQQEDNDRFMSKISSKWIAEVKNQETVRKNFENRNENTLDKINELEINEKQSEAITLTTTKQDTILNSKRKDLDIVKCPENSKLNIRQDPKISSISPQKIESKTVNKPNIGLGRGRGLISLKNVKKNVALSNVDIKKDVPVEMTKEEAVEIFVNETVNQLHNTLMDTKEDEQKLISSNRTNNNTDSFLCNNIKDNHILDSDSEDDDNMSSVSKQSVSVCHVKPPLYRPICDYNEISTDGIARDYNELLLIRPNRDTLDYNKRLKGYSRRKELFTSGESNDGKNSLDQKKRNQFFQISDSSDEEVKYCNQNKSLETANTTVDPKYSSESNFGFGRGSNRQNVVYNCKDTMLTSPVNSLLERGRGRGNASLSTKINMTLSLTSNSSSSRNESKSSSSSIVAVDHSGNYETRAGLMRLGSSVNANRDSEHYCEYRWPRIDSKNVASAPYKEPETLLSKFKSGNSSAAAKNSNIVSSNAALHYQQQYESSELRADATDRFVDDLYSQFGL